MWLTHAMAADGPDLGRRESHPETLLVGADLGDDPVPALWGWLAEAEGRGEPQFNAMVLATVGTDGQPTARNVLLRGIDDRGRLRFFTNSDSRKGAEIDAQPKVGLLFSWLGAFRQVRVDGTAEVLPTVDSDAYFADRPRESQLANWAGTQSSVIPDRDALDAGFAAARERFEGVDVPPPPTWVGYGVVPHSVEFWQGRSNRMHDRIRFRRSDPGSPWVRERLAP